MENLKVSKRALEIIVEISNGASAKEISDRLFISILTVNTHRRNILQKLKAKNAPNLIRKSLELGLIKI